MCRGHATSFSEGGPAYCDAPPFASCSALLVEYSRQLMTDAPYDSPPGADLAEGDPSSPLSTRLFQPSLGSLLIRLS